MEFLVTIRQDWSALRDRADLADLVAAERRVGRQLISERVLLRVWRLPGQRANVGVWRATDPTALHGLLDRLPMRRWLDADVLALAAHELQP